MFGAAACDIGLEESRHRGEARACQKQFVSLKSGPYVSFPLVAGLETVALCNAAGEFRPYPSLERKGGDSERRRC